MTLQCSSGGSSPRYSSEKYDLGVPFTYLRKDLLFLLAPLITTKLVIHALMSVPFLNLPQFLDPLLLSLEVYRETHRQVQFLAAAASMKRKWVGYFARLMDSSKYAVHLSYNVNLIGIHAVPVSRAADMATAGIGKVILSTDDPCIVIGEGTKFTEDFSPRMQILLPKSVNSAIAEVVEVISDTQLRIKKEFGGGDSGKGTARIRDKLQELKETGVNGLDHKKLPFVDQQDMYRHVYQCLREGGSIGIFPEGESILSLRKPPDKMCRRKPRSYRFTSAQGRCFNHGSRCNGKRSYGASKNCTSWPVLFPRPSLSLSSCC